MYNYAIFIPLRGINNLRNTIIQCEQWLSDQVNNAHAKGIVLGLSGGIDSSVLAAIGREALGRDGVLGVIMPCHSIQDDEADARLLAEAVDVDFVRVDLSGVYDALCAGVLMCDPQTERDSQPVIYAPNWVQDSQPATYATNSVHDSQPATYTTNLVHDSQPATYTTNSVRDSQPLAHAHDSHALDSLTRSNIKARLRMVTLYAFAQSRNLLVCGTSNRSEYETGYFTKYGDSGVDLMPLAGFLKRDIRKMARLLNVPERIITKAPSAGLYAGQTDESDMGFTYDILDEYLATGHINDPAAQQRIDVMRRRSEHKRKPIPIFRVSSEQQ